MVAGTVGAAAFVQALHEGCTGVTEYRIINADGAATKAFGDPEDVVRAHPDENVFVGVATRQDRSSGTLENCQHLPALFCDIDYKVTPEASALQRLEHFPLAPSIIVASGGGVHVYWMLREPFDLTVEAERDQARALLRRLALELGGDVAAGECARVLRVPGSWNVKPEYGTPRPVVVQHFDPDRRYNPSELDEVLLPEITPAGAGPSAPFILPATIPESAPGRNPTLFRYGRSLKASGVKPLRIIEALHQVNRERCIPPLAPDEMDTIVNSVLGTADRPSFTQNGHPERPAPATAPSIEIIDAADLVVREFPEEQALVGGGLIVPRALVVNGGAPKRGKSLLVLNREICRALGRPFLGFPTTPGRTLYLQAEIPEPQLKARLVLMLSSALDAGPIDGERLRGHLLTVTRRGLFLDESAGYDAVRRLIDQAEPDLLSIDPLARFMVGEETSARDVGALINNLDRLIQEYRIALELTHHAGKPTSGDPRQGGHRLRGSSALFGAADTVTMLDRTQDGWVLSFELRHAEEPAPMVLTRTPALWFTDAGPPEKLLAVALIVKDIPMRWSTLVGALKADAKVSESTAERMVRDAKQARLIWQDDTGRYRQNVGHRQPDADGESTIGKD